MTSKIQDVKIVATCEVHDLKNVVSGWYGAAPSVDPPTNFLPRSLVRKDVVNMPAWRKTPGCRRPKIDAFEKQHQHLAARREPAAHLVLLERDVQRRSWTSAASARAALVGVGMNCASVLCSGGQRQSAWETEGQKRTRRTTLVHAASRKPFSSSGPRKRGHVVVRHLCGSELRQHELRQHEPHGKQTPTSRTSA